MDHDANVIGATVLALSDGIRVAVTKASGRADSQSAALTALHGWADGVPIESLAKGLDLSHSRTVRVIDALADDGLVRRRSDRHDRRRIRIELTASGRRLALTVLEARSEVIDAALTQLSHAQRASLASISEALLTAAATDRARARVICRLCDLVACGHLEGSCPTTLGADQSVGATG